MTDPQLQDISFGGVLVHRQLSANARDLAMRVVDELAGQLSAYGALPLEELRSEIMRVAYQGIHGFVEVLRTGELPGREQLAVIREAAADRAEEGLMLDSVISAYHLSAQGGARYVDADGGAARRPGCPHAEPGADAVPRWSSAKSSCTGWRTRPRHRSTGRATGCRTQDWTHSPRMRPPCSSAGKRWLPT
ncbi:hypothetical protein F0344_06740 [Streptomyces finlayi]|uniref:RsbT co-antagonist protein RsbRD N-terminal domain-containing protein n=1 Tax=Streptomyces finlayi TaxID=67296 RepID=A0A7G7BG78_9ACTN|nr:hypothetical protein [Streptomyces finlayi]QNE74343.1 hypothetical protein F0344_06740 [Streptomyces finlayi]